MNRITIWTLCHISSDLTLVVTVWVVGAVVVVVVVLDNAGFQTSNRQNVGSEIGADSASIQIIFYFIIK